MTGSSPFDDAHGDGSGDPRKQGDVGESLLRDLIGMDPSAFLNLIGEPVTGPVRVVEAGVFPHVLPIERVLRVRSSEPWIGVVGIAASHDPSLFGAILTAVVSLPYDVPAVPIAALLRPEAVDPSLTGEYDSRQPSSGLGLQFRYHVVRVWEEDLDRPLGDAWPEDLARQAGSGLSELIAELRESGATTDAPDASIMCLVFGIPEGTPPSDKLVADVTTMERLAPCVYLGLRKNEDVRIVSREEGCAVMRWKLYQRGTRKLGSPDGSIAATIGSIASPRRLTDLDHLLARIDSTRYPITSWHQLLAFREPAD